MHSNPTRRRAPPGGLCPPPAENALQPLITLPNNPNAPIADPWTAPRSLQSPTPRPQPPRRWFSWWIWEAYRGKSVTHQRLPLGPHRRPHPRPGPGQHPPRPHRPRAAPHMGRDPVLGRDHLQPAVEAPGCFDAARPFRRRRRHRIPIPGHPRRTLRMLAPNRQCGPRTTR